MLMRVRVPSDKRRATPDQHWLTYDQAARRAGVSKRTIQTWAYKGDLQVSKIGSIVRIHVDVLDKMLAERMAS